MIPMHLRPLLPLLALLAVPAMADTQPAGRTVDDLVLGAPVAGPKITPAMLKKRVVVVVPWDAADSGALLEVLDLQRPYAKGEILLIANQVGALSAQEAAKAWKEGDASGNIPVLHGCSFKGGQPGAPLPAMVFNITGKQVYPKAEIQGKGKNDQPLTAAIAAAVRFSGQGLTGAQSLAMGRAQDLFGDGLPKDLLKVAVALADPSRPSEPALRFLEAGANSKKDPILAAQAKKMVETFGEHIAGEFAAAKALAETDPPEALAAMRRLADWVPQKKEGKDAKAQIADWMKDKAFADELEADKRWLALKAQGDKLDYAKNPRVKPLPQLEADYAALLRKYPNTAAARKAKEAAKDWRLDPETGKFAPQPAK